MFARLARGLRAIAKQAAPGAASPLRHPRICTEYVEERTGDRAGISVCTFRPQPRFYALVPPPAEKKPGSSVLPNNAGINSRDNLFMRYGRTIWDQVPRSFTDLPPAAASLKSI